MKEHLMIGLVPSFGDLELDGCGVVLGAKKALIGQKCVNLREVSTNSYIQYWVHLLKIGD